MKIRNAAMLRQLAARVKPGIFRLTRGTESTAYLSPSGTRLSVLVVFAVVVGMAFFSGLSVTSAYKSARASLTAAAPGARAERSAAGLVSPAMFAADTIAVYAADCESAQASWNLGGTICARATGATGFRRIVWFAPNGEVARVSSPYNDNGSDSYTLPTSTSDPFAQFGNWRVRVTNSDGDSIAAASFLVQDPASARADLSIVKSGPDTVSPGGTLTYTVTVYNFGPDDAQNVQITDATPASTTFSSATQTSGGGSFNCANSGGTTTCTATTTLAANTTAAFTFVYNVSSTVPIGSNIRNTASVTSTTTEPQAQQSDDQASFDTAVIAVATSSCTLTCPGDVSASTTTCTAIVNFATPTASGSCGTVTCSPASGSAFPIGTTLVTCTTQNGGDCSFNVTVTGNDTTPPTITCPSNITTPEDPPGSGQAVVSWPTPAAADNCTQEVSVTCNPPSGTTFNTGISTVTCTATDASNNSSSCTFTVTVATVTCVLTCPSDVTTSGPSSGCDKVVTYPAPTYTGSCGTVTCAPASGSSFPTGTTVVTCTARDTSGNPITTCSFNVTVQDSGTLTCPANITVPESSPGSGSAFVQYATPATCSSVSATCNPPSESNFPVGTTTVSCTTPSSGPSCNFTVTVTSSTTCTVTCPSNITKNNDPGQCGATATYSVTKSGSSCDSDPVPCNPPTGTFFPVGTTTVTCDYGTGTCSFTVTVNDTQAPTIGACPTNITKSTDPGQCSAVTTFATPTVSDNCPGATVTCSPASGTAFQKGTTTVTCTARDAANNTSTCSFTVTVNDNERPTVSCPANITKSTDPNVCTAVVTFTATASDNCPGATVSCSPASGSTFQKGVTTVTCSATDASGNTSASSCSFTVTVNDTQPPAITCPANQTLEPTCPSGAIATYTAPVGTDNCPGVTTARTAGPASGSVFPVGTTTVTYTATDASGNTTSCSFTVTVLTAQQVIQNLKNQVLALQNTGKLSGQQAQGLTSKLDAALDAVNNGQTNVACNKLGDFVSQVQAYINNGTLSSADGQPLINSANHVRNYLGCTNLPCS